MERELYHHGILGQKWGVRRYQNPDGTLTEAGKRREAKKDNKWIDKNYDKIYSKAYKDSKKELKKYEKKVLKKQYKSDGRLYMNAKNQKLAELMNTAVGDLAAPSGRVVKFVARRGEEGVYMALADKGYDMNQVRKGVWDSGKIAYKNKSVDRR